MTEKRSPFSYEKNLFVFSSFGEPHLKEISKDRRTLIMPVWTMDELQELTSCPYFNEITDNEYSLEDLQKKFITFGGSIRSVLTPNLAKLDTALSKSGKMLVEHFFSGGVFGGDNKENPDMLIHRNPKVDKEGNYVYSSAEHYSFASSYVFYKLYQLHKAMILAKARDRYVNGLSYGSDDGCIFETLSFLCFKLKGPYTVSPLLSKNLNQKDPLPIVIPERMEILPSN
jgi:hypothetical protein